MIPNNVYLICLCLYLDSESCRNCSGDLFTALLSMANAPIETGSPVFRLNPYVRQVFAPYLLQNREKVTTSNCSRNAYTWRWRIYPSVNHDSLEFFGAHSLVSSTHFNLKTWYFTFSLPYEGTCGDRFLTIVLQDKNCSDRGSVVSLALWMGAVVEVANIWYL